jgi:formamidopyrimidine-DNA glycosylase
MPELPEVESVVRSLREFIIGQQISGVRVTNNGLRSLGGVDPEDFRAALIGKEIAQVSRVGKFIVVDFTAGKNSEGQQRKSLIVHLRMTGRFLYLPSEQGQRTQALVTPQLLSYEMQQEQAEAINKTGADPYTHTTFTLSNGNLHFSDKRRFGTLHLAPAGSYAGIARLGPDALSSEFNAEYLAKILHKRVKPIYSALLDQALVAGLGNIYVCESLYAAGVHPLRRSQLVQPSELEAIVSAAKRILLKSIELGGTSFSDYQDAKGKLGAFKDFLQIYQKPQATRIRIGGRTAHFDFNTQR